MRPAIICNRYSHVYHLGGLGMKWWALCGVTGWITTDKKKRLLCKRCEKMRLRNHATIDERLI